MPEIEKPPAKPSQGEIIIYDNFAKCAIDLVRLEGPWHDK